jgi:hypothetical protein
MITRVAIAVCLAAMWLALPRTAAAQSGPPDDQSTSTVSDADGSSPAIATPQEPAGNPPATQPTSAKAQRGAPPVNDDDGLEHEADVMGAKVATPQ